MAQGTKCFPTRVNTGVQIPRTTVKLAQVVCVTNVPAEKLETERRMSVASGTNYLSYTAVNTKELVSDNVEREYQHTRFSRFSHVPMHL